jgi:hypothetical protein
MTGQQLVNEVLLELNQDGIGAAVGLGDGAATDDYTIEPSAAVLVWLNEAQQRLNRTIWKVGGIASTDYIGSASVIRFSDLVNQGPHGDLFDANQVLVEDTVIPIAREPQLMFYRDRYPGRGDTRYAVVLDEGISLVPFLQDYTLGMTVYGWAYGRPITLADEILDMAEPIQQALKVWARLRAAEKLENEGYGPYCKAAKAEWEKLTGEGL